MIRYISNSQLTVLSSLFTLFQTGGLLGLWMVFCFLNFCIHHIYVRQVSQFDSKSVINNLVFQDSIIIFTTFLFCLINVHMRNCKSSSSSSTAKIYRLCNIPRFINNIHKLSFFLLDKGSQEDLTNH